MNPIWENSRDTSGVIADVPIVPASTWQEKCPIGLDILESAGLSYDEDGMMMQPFDKTKFDNLVRIHEKLETWLINNDRYHLYGSKYYKILYGASNLKDDKEGMFILYILYMF